MEIHQGKNFSRLIFRSYTGKFKLAGLAKVQAGTKYAQTE
jgi:hypothetical protein